MFPIDRVLALFVLLAVVMVLIFLLSDLTMPVYPPPAEGWDKLLHTLSQTAPTPVR